MQEGAFLFTSFSFLFGLVVGSFLNVLIIRGGKRAFGGRSRCLSCRKKLSWYELIPVASFFVQKRRCRSCGSALLWQYPLVELGTGVAYAAVAQASLTSSIGLLGLMGVFVAIAAAIVVIVSDLRWQIIPNGAVLTLVIIGAVFTTFRMYHARPGTAVFSVLGDVGAAFAIAFFLAALWFFSRGQWMGFGDVKLVLALSLMVGFPASVAAFLFSFWIGGLWGVGMLLFKKGDLKSVMPFGPFLIVGAILGHFFVENILAFIIII